MIDFDVENRDFYVPIFSRFIRLFRSTSNRAANTISILNIDSFLVFIKREILFSFRNIFFYNTAYIYFMRD